MGDHQIHPGLSGNTQFQNVWFLFLHNVWGYLSTQEKSLLKGLIKYNTVTIMIILFFLIEIKFVLWLIQNKSEKKMYFLVFQNEKNLWLCFRK